MGKEKLSRTPLILNIVIGFLIAMAIMYIWNTFFVNETAWDALEGEPGQPGTMQVIDEKNSLAVLTPEDGFHVYIVSRGLFGWNVKDDIFISKDDLDEPVVIQREKLMLHNDDDLHILLVTSEDQEVGYVKARDKNGDTFGFNGSPNDGTYLFYVSSTEEFAEELTFEAYTYGDELLYEIEE